MALAWVAPAGCHSHHYAWEARHPEFHGFRAGRTCVVLPQPKLRKHECPTATGRPSCASCSGTPDGDGSDDTALEDTVYRTTLTRGVFLRHAATALAGAISVFGRPQAIFALDPQRDKNTALPPPPALLLPVQRIRIAATNLADLLNEPTRWEEALSLLRSPPLSDPEFRTTLDRYSDSNWEKHILGDLYRNQGLESIKALKEMMAFALEQQGKGTEISQEDVQDVGEAGHALVESLDNFVSLAPPTDVKLIEKLVSDSSPK